MQKKLLAVAVAGVFAAPAAVLAQTATVNVYGTLYGEYGFINNGAQTGTTSGLKNYDHFQAPGSELGIRGSENIGGGMSVWFQCATTMDFRGPNNSQSNSQGGGLCSRASALGIRGAFGNVFAGNWDTPWKRVNVMGNTGSNDTGIWGNAHVVAGGSSTYSMVPPANQIPNWSVQATNSAATASSSVAAFTNGQIGSVSTGAYRRRQIGLFTYETPNLSGFTGFVATTPRNFASQATGGQFNTRLWSLGGTYVNGPIALGAAWEKHRDVYDRGTIGNVATATLNTASTNGNGVGVPGSDKSWTMAATYTFANRLKLGGSYQKFKSEQNRLIDGDVKLTTWHLGVDWMFAGPHGMRAAYSKAGDVKGAPGASMNNRNTAVGAGSDTGATMWQIRYVYSLSKRSEFTAGYSKTNNDRFGTYETGGTTTRQNPGSDSSAFGLALRHTF